MSRYDVRVAPRAQGHIDEVAAWWKTNRQAAPLLVVDEFEAAAKRLSIAPLSGAIYRRTMFRSLDQVPGTNLHSFGVNEVAVTGTLAMGAVEEDLPHGDPADRIIVATARSLGAQLATADKVLLDALPFVIW